MRHVEQAIAEMEDRCISQSLRGNPLEWKKAQAVREAIAKLRAALAQDEAERTQQREHAYKDDQTASGFCKLCGGLRAEHQHGEKETTEGEARRDVGAGPESLAIGKALALKAFAQWVEGRYEYYGDRAAFERIIDRWFADGTPASATQYERPREGSAPTGEK